MKIFFTQTNLFTSDFKSVSYLTKTPQFQNSFFYISEMTVFPHISNEIYKMLIHEDYVSLYSILC